MAKWSSKHPEREQLYSFRNFTGGLNLEAQPSLLTPQELSQCCNFKYGSRVVNGEPVVILKQRQGTERISATALTGAADVMACTYYIDQSKYILATSSKLYYLSAAYAPVEIGSISGTPTFTEFNGKLIIHDSGTTKSWDGTTLATINTLFSDEVVGTGDGAETNFTGNLDELTIEPGSITITFTSSGIAYTITDDGDGNLEGDVNAGGNNTINYTSGAYDFTCSAAPDNSTSLTADYEQVDTAPKSKAGLVRASRLYVWGSSDYPSRLYYTAVNDETAWDDSSDGGYLDVDPDDGGSIIGVLNFFQSLLVLKENSMHRIDNFPGDTDFQVEPLINELGSLAYRTCINDGDLISFLSKEGWVAMSPTERYGDVQRGDSLSRKFQSLCVRHANAYAYSAYNRIDKQLWLTLYDSENSTYLPQVFVISLETGGQLSLYKFAFTHSCYTFVNSEMLIGGTDGHLYRLYPSDSRFYDYATSYASDTFMRTGFVNWNNPFHRKHNKKLNIHVEGRAGFTATLNIYKNRGYAAAIDSISLDLTNGNAWVNPDGLDIYVYDLQGVYISAATQWHQWRKFNYDDVMIEITDPASPLGIEIYGIDLASAIIGD